MGYPKALWALAFVAATGDTVQAVNAVGTVLTPARTTSIAGSSARGAITVRCSN